MARLDRLHVGALAKAFMQDHGMWFARNGYVCLILDTIERGELPGRAHQGLYREERWWWLSAGLGELAPPPRAEPEGDERKSGDEVDDDLRSGGGATRRGAPGARW